MARPEFEAFKTSLLMNYRRVPARADPPRARSLEVKKVEGGSLADQILLAPGDLLLSVNGKAGGLLDPKLWRNALGRIREYVFYSPASKERIELTTTGVDLGCEFRRTPELIRASYKPETRDPEPLMELWEANAWPTLLSLSLAALQAGKQDTPILALYGAALYETGQKAQGVDLCIKYIKEFARGWIMEYRTVAYFYVAQARVLEAAVGTAVEILEREYYYTPIDKVADELVRLGRPRPSPPVLWEGKVVPDDYELTTLDEGADRTVTLFEALDALPDGHVFLLCLLDGYRGNGPYMQFMQRYETYLTDFNPFVGALHVVTEKNERYPGKEYLFETEDKLRARKAPLTVLFDETGEVFGTYQGTGSPFIMAIDRNRRVLSEGQMDGLDIWRAMTRANL